MNRLPRKAPLSRCDADQGRELAAVEVSELGQVGHETARGGRSDAGHREEQILGLPPGRTRPDRGVAEIGAV
jgi:hypothetical protein